MLYSYSKVNLNYDILRGKISKSACCEYIVINVIDLLILWGGDLNLCGRPQAIYVNMCFGIC